MARTVEVKVPERREGATRERAALARKTRVVVKKVSPWSVFKFSLIYYFCLMMVILLGLTILYNILGAFGVLESIAEFIGTLWVPENAEQFEINGGWLFTRAFAVGIVMVVFWSLVKLLVTFMYNLISDLVGGIEVTLTERR
jgi:hypothetical protein